MSAFWGQDTEQLRAQAARLHGASAEVAALQGRLDVLVQGSTWTGPDSDAFRARWHDEAARALGSVVDELDALGERGLEEADEQDVVSAPNSAAAGSGRPSSQLAELGSTGTGDGYQHRDTPWVPNWLEIPAEGLSSSVAQMASDGIGWGLDGGIDRLELGLDGLGVRTDGIAQFQRDADHLGGILEEWATGERVPTYAELGAAAAVTSGSAGVGVYEAITGEDTALLDDRPGGRIESVESVPGTSRSPQDLQDLIAGNDALRRDNPGQGALGSGQIGIQEVHGADGGASSYIVQVPPTEGAAIDTVPDAYGGQGNSRDWGSNLRLVAGQHPAAMDDVRAAMEAANIPPGSRVLLVGHSQGGIITNHLAADPTFNNASGQDGTYDVTHTFSIGSPVQTVVPAQGTTHSVNVNHDSGLGLDGFHGDLIAASDLQGAQPFGTHLSAPNRHEVTLPAYPISGVDPLPVLGANHDSMGPGGDPAGGYSGSVADGTAGDPTLSALQEDLTGRYLGEGTSITEAQVVTVGRGDL